MPPPRARPSAVVLAGVVAALGGCGRVGLTNPPNASAANQGDAAGETPADAAAAPDVTTTCAPLGPPPVGPRPSSRRADDCDYAEQADFTIYDLLCDPPVPCEEPPQTGDQLCHHICDDGACAAGERCERRPIYFSDTPTRYANLCVCPASGCPPVAPPVAAGGLALWQADAPLPRNLYRHAAAAGAGRVFVAGGLSTNQGAPGETSSSARNLDEVLAGSLDGDGRVTAWAVAGVLPTPLTSHAIAVARGRLYVAGGGLLAFQADVSSAALRADGSLGPWRAEPPLPSPRGGHRLLADDGHLVVAGGARTAEASTRGVPTIWVTALGDDGVVSRWDEASAPGPIFDGAAGVARGRLYVLGEDGVLRSAAISAPNDWRSEATWHIYPPALGAIVPTSGVDSVDLFEQCGAMVAIINRGQTLTAPLDAAGVVGPWRSASRVSAAFDFAAAAGPNRLYILGGFSRATGPGDVWSTRRQ